ncbi:MAG TPA: extracellular solute-binding protein [Jatrophihabitans sp.]|nr:extracellular solute-binding protein [Jatrophihabitans sp.]
MQTATHHVRRSRRWCRAVLATLLIASVPACATSSTSAASPALTLYTCASANVEQAVVTAFRATHPGTAVKVFRAPTGQLNARVSADTRSGGIRADVIWACDPLTMHGYDEQGLLASWQPPNAAAIPAAYRTPHFAGVDVLYVVVVVRSGQPAPATWMDLTASRFHGPIAIPSPTFAASALGLMGYFASAPNYGMNYYRSLKRNGAVQVDTPADALTGVEQGTYAVGVTLANAAYADQKKGSPIQVVWPRPGGVAVYAPIGITTKPHRSTLAASFASFVASTTGQRVLARNGTYPVLPRLGGPPIPAGARVAVPDWPSLFSQYKRLLAEYSSIYG